MPIPKSVSDWKPEPGNKNINEKLFSTEAHESPDMANGTNSLEQYKGKPVSAKSYGTLGRRGKEF